MQIKLFNTVGDICLPYIFSAWYRLIQSAGPGKQRAARSNTPQNAFTAHRLAAQTPTWECCLNSHVFNYLKDHRVDGEIVFPGSAYVEIGLALHRAVCAQEELILKNFKFQKALLLGEGDAAQLRFNYDEEKREFIILSKPSNKESQWVRHASGELSTAEFTQVLHPNLETLRELCCEAVDIERFYKRLWSRGLQYGHSFRRVQRLWRTNGEMLAQIEVPNSPHPSAHMHYLHPTVLDACFQSLTAALDSNVSEAHLYLPVRIGEVRYHANPSHYASSPANLEEHIWCHGYLSRNTKSAIEGDLTLYDEAGNVLVEVFGLCCLRARRKKVALKPDSLS